MTNFSPLPSDKSLGYYRRIPPGFIIYSSKSGPLKENKSGGPLKVSINKQIGPD
jgi:hypothetical protein